MLLDMELGDSARFADLVLPVTSWYESCDIRVACNNPYTLFQGRPSGRSARNKPAVRDSGAHITHCPGPRARSFPARTTRLRQTGLPVLPANTDATRGAGPHASSACAPERSCARAREPGKALRAKSSARRPTSRSRQLYCENPAPRLDYGQGPLRREPRAKHVVPALPRARSGMRVNSLPCGSTARVPSGALAVHASTRVGPPAPARARSPSRAGEGERRRCACARRVTDGDMVEVFNDRGHAVVRYSWTSPSPRRCSPVIPRGGSATSSWRAGTRKMTRRPWIRILRRSPITTPASISGNGRDSHALQMIVDTQRCTGCATCSIAAVWRTTCPKACGGRASSPWAASTHGHAHRRGRSNAAVSYYTH